MNLALNELGNERIRQFLLRENCDYDVFDFKMNVPSSSHMGGVWERQMRSVRNVFATLLYKHGTQLNDESLRTFLRESAAVVNSRFLSVDNINDHLSTAPVILNHLLTFKSKVVLPPSGNFQSTNLYSQKCWRRTQYLVNEFWSRWRSAFLQNWQARQKWLEVKRNMIKGGIVFLKDENQLRNYWRLGRIAEVYEDDDGLVRKIKLMLADSNLNAKGKRNDSHIFLERPVH